MLPIVIVDDSKEDLALVTRVFRQCKIINPIHAFASARECLEYLDGIGVYRDRKLPCLIVIDLVMAPTSGLDVLRHIQKSNAGGEMVPVMLSGLQDVRAIREGYQLGAVTFLLKPLKVEEVMVMVNAARGLRVERVPTGYLLYPASRSLTDDSKRGQDDGAETHKLEG